jgi:hypothetical protein
VTNILAYCNTVKNYNCKRFEAQAHEKEKEGEENKKTLSESYYKKVLFIDQKILEF